MMLSDSLRKASYFVLSNILMLQMEFSKRVKKNNQGEGFYDLSKIRQ